MVFQFVVLLEVLLATCECRLARVSSIHQEGGYLHPRNLTIVRALEDELIHDAVDTYGSTNHLQLCV